MITKKQLDIIEVFQRDMLKELTTKNIKEALNVKSQSLIPIYLRELENQGLLLKNKISNLNLYQLNYLSPEIYSFLRILNWKKVSGQVKDTITNLIFELNKTGIMYSLVIFGSFANAKNKKESDLDIGIFIDSKNSIKAIKSAYEDLVLNSLIKLDIHVLTFSEFEEMLIADYENLGKEICRNNLPLHNVESFYYTMIRNFH